MEPKVQNRIFRINKKVPDVSIDGKVKIIFDRTTWIIWNSGGNFLEMFSIIRKKIINEGKD